MTSIRVVFWPAVALNTGLCVVSLSYYKFCIYFSLFSIYGNMRLTNALSLVKTLFRSSKSYYFKFVPLGGVVRKIARI